jgi:hypothetical protein
MRKKFGLDLMVAAAMLTLGPKAVYAQDHVVYTQIPFEFRLNGTQLPAGEYNVKWLLNNKKVMQFRNVETGESDAVLVRNSTESKNNRPHLTFYCGEPVCSLAELSFGQGQGWEFMQVPGKRGDREHMATIYLDQKVDRNSK